VLVLRYHNPIPNPNPKSYPILKLGCAGEVAATVSTIIIIIIIVVVVVVVD